MKYFMPNLFSARYAVRQISPTLDPFAEKGELERGYV